MNKKDYILMGILLLIAIAGAWFGGYWGGFISGSCFSISLFASVGKILYKKAEQRTNAAIGLASAIKKQNETA